jgi:hypothetical protein
MRNRAFVIFLKGKREATMAGGIPELDEEKHAVYKRFF